MACSPRHSQPFFGVLLLLGVTGTLTSCAHVARRSCATATECGASYACVAGRCVHETKMISAETSMRTIVDGSWLRLPLREGKTFVQFPTAALGQAATHSPTTLEAYVLIRLTPQSTPTPLTLYPVRRGSLPAPRRGPATSRTIVPALDDVARLNVLEALAGLEAEEPAEPIVFEMEGDVHASPGSAPQLELYRR